MPNGDTALATNAGIKQNNIEHNESKLQGIMQPKNHTTTKVSREKEKTTSHPPIAVKKT